MATPRLSVLVPARNAEDHLAVALPALLASRLDRTLWELIVVDDSSADGTALIAAVWADRVIRLEGGPYGPAHARNEGARAARGEVLVFVDADVAVSRTALEAIANCLLGEDPEHAAVFGSYDSDPTASGVVSRFRNLLHHLTHHEHPGPAETFWAGLGAVRRSAFVEVGGFDARRYPTPQIEDIELGRRLRLGGHRILLDPRIVGTHHKRWTLAGMLRTDFAARAVPWTRLLLEEGGVRGGRRPLNLRRRERVSALLVVVSVVGATVAAPFGGLAACVLSAAALAGMAWLNRDLYALLWRVGGVRLAGAGLALHSLHFLSAAAGFALGWSLFRGERTLASLRRLQSSPPPTDTQTLLDGDVNGVAPHPSGEAAA